MTIGIPASQSPAGPPLKDDPRIREELAQCSISTEYTAKLLFPQRFFRPFSSIHRKIFEAIDNPVHKKVLILAPRGTGKTSTVNLAYAARNVIFREKKHIVVIGNNATNITTQTENLKTALMENRIIRDVFGEFKSKKWAQAQWLTKSDGDWPGTMVWPRGAGQKIRGLLAGDSRPDLIIGDDIEDPEGVKNPDIRKDLRDWFYNDVLFCVDRGSDDWKIVLIGTILHEDCLLANLMEDPEWHVVQLALCDEKGNSVWPEFMTTEQILHSIQHARQVGQLDGWYRENMNKVICSETASFKQEYFRHYDKSESDLDNDPNIESVILVDPAKTTSKTACDTAIVGCSINLDEGRYYVRDIVNGKLHPDQQIKEAFAMAERLRTRVIAVEETSLNEFIRYPFQNAAIQQGKNFEFVWLAARGGQQAQSKDARIDALMTPYRLGEMYHNPACCLELEGQLLSHPRSKKKDIADALAYIIELMEMGHRYFTPREDKYESPEEIEQEYADLHEDYEPAISGDRWDPGLGGGYQ